MADSEETLALRRRARRRLVGAIALVLALVIIPPWIMDLEPKPVVTNLTVEIPKQESVGLKPPAPPPSPAAKPPESPPSPATKPPEPAAMGQPPRAPEAKPEAAPKRDAAKANRDPEAKRAEAILNAEAYVVPLGSFASKDNVKQLEAKLAKAGVKHYTENIPTSSGEQTRVRAGPYTTKAAAESSRDKLKSLGLDPGPVTSR